MTTDEDQIDEQAEDQTVSSPPEAPLTQAQIQVLYTRGLIDRTAWTSALLALRGSRHTEGQRALQTCEIAIEALVERAVDAACAAIQERLGIKTGDLAATVLSDGTIERELTRYVLAELTMAGEDNDVVPPSEPAPLSEPAPVSEDAPSDPEASV